MLIDSTGLENSIQTYFTAINNHNGKISNEIRLIYAIDRLTEMPIYFRFVPGNIIDVSTLVNTIQYLDSYRINISHLVLDAGYYAEQNLKDLIKNNIPFIIRAKKILKYIKD
jgi:transposase